jgi:hypothetical protein
LARCGISHTPLSGKALEPWLIATGTVVFSGKIEIDKVWENERVLAFTTLNPRKDQVARRNMFIFWIDGGGWPAFPQ